MRRSALVISKEPESGEYFVDDTDRQQFTIKSYAFDNTNFDAWTAFYAAKVSSPAASTSGNLDVVIHQDERVTGSCEASNAFGAKAQIVKIDQEVQVIFQRQSRKGFESLFVSDDKAGVLGTLMAAPADAQS